MRFSEALEIEIYMLTPEELAKDKAGIELAKEEGYSKKETRYFYEVTQVSPNYDFPKLGRIHSGGDIYATPLTVAELRTKVEQHAARFGNIL